MSSEDEVKKAFKNMEEARDKMRREAQRSRLAFHAQEREYKALQEENAALRTLTDAQTSTIGALTESQKTTPGMPVRVVVAYLGEGLFVCNDGCLFKREEWKDASTGFRSYVWSFVENVPQPEKGEGDA